VAFTPQPGQLDALPGTVNPAIRASVEARAAKRARRRASLELLSRTATNPPTNGEEMGAVNAYPRPSWASEGKPLHAESSKLAIAGSGDGEAQPAKDDGISGAGMTALSFVAWKRTQRLRSRIVAKALHAIPRPLVNRAKYASTLACGTQVTRAAFGDDSVKRLSRGVVELTPDGVSFGAACGQRWCEPCQGTRIMKWRKKYGPLVAEWKNLQHLCVTIPTVPSVGKGGIVDRGATADVLRSVMRDMIRAAREIANDIRRTEKMPWVALRKLECTYSVENDWYHPHFHFIVEGEAPAREFLRRWLQRFPRAKRAAQFLEEVDAAKGMREIFKYVAKSIKSHRSTDPETGRSVVRYEGMPAPSLDVIFSALRGLRSYQPMGFKAAAPDDLDAACGIEEDGTLPAAEPSPGRDASMWEWSDRWLDWLHVGSSRGLLQDQALPARYLRMLAKYETQVWSGMGGLFEGGPVPEARTDGLVARCAYMEWGYLR
jgi:signal recognition particle subunit SEC65